MSFIKPFTQRQRLPDAPRVYRATGYPIMPALYILMGLAFCILLIICKPNYTWTGLIITLVGIPV
ncbi:hypothetical protein ACO2Q8_17515 [Larkinella sp. VNQ87]|uniref:hypothetical protein n=1 Tax=Larkinella sp. VNQ87 TaxID=3400921 RepID=UPI003BFC6419